MKEEYPKIIMELRCPNCNKLLSEPYFVEDIKKCMSCALTWRVEGDFRAIFIDDPDYKV